MKGAVASGSEDTSKAGQFAFQQGGNAIDALIASQLAAHVCEPLLTGFGGAGLAMVKYQGEVHYIDMFTSMPGLSNKTNHPEVKKIELNFGTTTQQFIIGEGTIAVPTIPKGLAFLHEKFGSLPLNVLAKPAIELCRNGFHVSSSCAYLLNLLMPVIETSQTMKNWYTTDSRPLAKGEICKLPLFEQDILHFLETKSEFFQSGIYAESIKSLHNSLLNQIDLHEYTVQSKTIHPRALTTKGRLFIADSPSIGGAVISDYQGWSDKEDTILKHLMSAYKHIEASKSNVVQDLQSNLGNTTHISTADEFGNVASLTSSLGESAGVVLSGTGVIMNNFLGEADVAHPKLIKLPGIRLLTMCAPTILEYQNQVLAIGSGGSSRIPGALIQVIQNIIKGMDLDAAINKSRFHPMLAKDQTTILAEPINESVRNAIQHEFADCHLKEFEERSLYFGGVHIAGQRDGELFGCGDPRRSGYCSIHK